MPAGRQIRGRPKGCRRGGPVLHDLNHASRYANHIIAMKDGAVVAKGAPSEVLTEALVEEVFGLPCRIIEDPVSGTPLGVPLGRPHPVG